jgi:putative flippase GtrA
MWNYSKAFIKKYRVLIKFVLIGTSNTLISFLMFIVFLALLGKNHYQLSLFASWVFSSVISFTLQKTIVFRTKGNWIKEYVKCLMTWSIGYGINAVSLELIVHYFELPILLGQILAILLTTISTFLLFKYFVFKKS